MTRFITTYTLVMETDSRYNIYTVPAVIAAGIIIRAGVAEQADATDLKSVEGKPSYRFDPGLRHHGSKPRIFFLGFFVFCTEIQFFTKWRVESDLVFD